MNLAETPGSRMDYIQNLFMCVQHDMKKLNDMSEILSYLNKEPPEFRSIGYESASMKVADEELKSGPHLENWKKLYSLAQAKHCFHVEIGLGWAFAKNGIDPNPYFSSLPPLTMPMVYDGIGYYFALFNGRRTIKNQSLPNTFQSLLVEGFDQGLGRRLWYTSKGNIDRLLPYLSLFPQERKPAIWRGVGIACGYVGGCDDETLKVLVVNADISRSHLASGIKLALKSRYFSESITADIVQACAIICGQSIHSILAESTNNACTTLSAT